MSPISVTKTMNPTVEWTTMVSELGSRIKPWLKKVLKSEVQETKPTSEWGLKMILEIFLSIQSLCSKSTEGPSDRSSWSVQNLNLNGCRPIIRVTWKWPDPCHVNPRGMTCIPLSFTPRIYLTNQRHVQQNDCITNFDEKFNSGFQTNKNHLWRHQSALRAKGLAWYSTDVYGFFSKLDDKFTFWTWNVLL